MSVTDEIIYDIMESKLNDYEFLKLIEALNLESLEKLKVELRTELDELRTKTKGCITRYRETGIPTCPRKFQKLKFRRTIREKQNMMLSHRIKGVKEAA